MRAHTAHTQTRTHTRLRTHSTKDARAHTECTHTHGCLKLQSLLEWRFGARTQKARHTLTYEHTRTHTFPRTGATIGVLGTSRSPPRRRMRLCLWCTHTHTHTHTCTLPPMYCFREKHVRRYAAHTPTNTLTTHHTSQDTRANTHTHTHTHIRTCKQAHAHTHVSPYRSHDRRSSMILHEAPLGGG